MIQKDLTDRIVALCDDYLVLNKALGESTEPSPPAGIVDLPRVLHDELGGAFSPPHRLDVPVSGCVLFARNPGTLSFLGNCFRTPGRVEKIYWGIAEPPREGEGLGSPGTPGSPPPSSPTWVELVHWLGTGRGNRAVAFDEEGPGRKRSVLRYRVVGRGERYLFLEIRPLTGRHHQIRAQLSRAGLPIKGDLKYGARRGEKSGGIRLHCRSLVFPDPASAGSAGTGRLIRVEAPPPAIDTLWRAFIDSITD
ncbi:MAG: RNA pseudouridine synthase [Treponema sp.]|nr:RNA pseudouridine synthase [Treponema sp.]